MIGMQRVWGCILSEKVQDPAVPRSVCHCQPLLSSACFLHSPELHFGLGAVEDLGEIEGECVPTGERFTCIQSHSPTGLIGLPRGFVVTHILTIDRVEAA